MPPVFSNSFLSVTSKRMFFEFEFSFILMMLMSNSSTLFSDITVNILALPCLISFGLATLYSLLFGSDDVYLPNIPDSVFSSTVP